MREVNLEVGSATENVFEPNEKVADEERGKEQELRSRAPSPQCKASYLDVARQPTILTELPSDREGKGKYFCQQNGSIYSNQGRKPQDGALLFKKYHKAEREQLEEAIREMLEKKRLLHVSFIGNSVMELLVEKEDSTGIIKLMKSAGMIHMPYFNVFENALGNRRPVHPNSVLARNISMVRGRARFVPPKGNNYWAKNGIRISPTLQTEG